MIENLYTRALKRSNDGRPPVWFMRQAGRYHSHYQELKKKHEFMELCKDPALASEVTRGPIEDFDFDAAILFSDLLFPLEAMGMGLTYEPGPKLAWHLRTKEDLTRLTGGAEKVSFMEFQAEALKKIRGWLPDSKGLIGFVGGPLTLFYYAVEGSHQGELGSAYAGLTDGRFNGFCEKLTELLAANMVLQAKAGADVLAVFDTCAGELSPEDYARHAVPALARALELFKKSCPDTPVVYYSKGTDPAHWGALTELPIDCLGVDWRNDITQVLEDWGGRFAIQGNIDPNWLFLDPQELERRLRLVFEEVKALGPAARRGWVCGLGHGVLPKTPEDNVRLFIRLQREIFS